MTKKSVGTLFAVLFLGVVSVAAAESIDERVNYAHRRIQQGIESGALTREEAHRLREEFSQIRRDEARFRADGHLGHGERERLNRELDRLERHISNLKHNNVTR